MNLPVKGFIVCDTDENVHEADDTTSFDQADDLLNKLRLENPDSVYSMYAEIDA